MVLVRLEGGLGNQLFQYATARRLALRLGSRVVVDTSLLEAPPPGVTPRPYELGKLRVEVEVAGPEAAALVRRRLARGWRGRASRLGAALGLGPRLTVLRDSETRFHPEVLEARGAVLLAGYWQSERYFDDVADRIRAEVLPRQEPGGASRLRAEAMRADRSVAVHVRRGDYITNPHAAAFHGTCDLAYYAAAAALVAARVPDPHFFVFTDDRDWARAHLHLPGRFTLVDDHGPAEGHLDLWLMRQCRHHVIANSSFSWWGAWLAGGEDHLVVAPDRWFTARPRPPHLLPAGWLAL
jgi:hypothetical protein